MKLFRFAVLVLLAASAFADDTPVAKPQLDGRPAMSKKTQLQMIRLLNAEFAFTKHLFPQGEKGVTLTTDGKFSPDDQALQMAVANKGSAARPGDRVQITNIIFKDRAMVFEINGGPKKKGHWYDHVQVGGNGGLTNIHEEQNANAKGSYLELEFPKHVPEMTLADVKALLAPALDFTAKSASQAYLDTLPPKVKQAITNHQVLVGMSPEMVVDAMGRAPQKVRERDGNTEYEEWIYGEPPADVQFIRFVGDEVTQVKIMPVGSEAIIRTAKEVIVDPRTGIAVMADASQQEKEAAAERKSAIDEAREASKAPAKKPTLRREGDDASVPAGDPAITVPTSGNGTQDPEWGTKKADGTSQPAPPPPPKR